RATTGREQSRRLGERTLKCDGLAADPCPGHDHLPAMKAAALVARMERQRNAGTAFMRRKGRTRIALRSMRAAISLVIFQVGEALILFRSAFERAPLLAGLPMHDLLDLLGEIEILVGDAFGRMVLQADLHPRVGRGDVGMMPGRLGEVA